jgi:AraC-like DNA-binding protein
MMTIDGNHPAARLRLLAIGLFWRLVNFANLWSRRSDHGPSRERCRAHSENHAARRLPHGKARADEVAGRLGLSPRTLARRLASEGLTFDGILSELRADLAKRYLRDETLAISQIAWLLGVLPVQRLNAWVNALTSL